MRVKPLLAALLFLTAIFPPHSVADDAVAAQIDELIQRAETGRLNGDHGAAVDAFNSALVLSKNNDHFHHAFISGNLAGVYMATGDLARAEQVLSNAIRVSETNRAEREFLPRLHNDLGRVHVQRGEKEKAGQQFQKAMRLAADGNDRELEAGSIFNLLLLQTDDAGDRVMLYRRALRSAGKLADAGSRGELLLRLGILSLADYETTRSGELIGLSIQSLDNAAAAFSPEQHPASLHEAWGRAGRAHTLAGDHTAAESYYRRAIKGSLQQNNLEQLYRWYWELARIKSGDNALPDALQYYELAVNAHQELFIGAAGGAELEKQTELYNEFLSLLLDGPKPDKAAFEKAIKTLEGLRTASIQDYFQDSCVAEARLNIGNIADVIEADTAILYPLMLKDRLRVLLVTRDGIRQQLSGLNRDTLFDAAEQLRSRIKDNDDGYLVQSRLLSAALIEPFADILKQRKISHLIIVPDHITAAIPYSALEYDDRFLLERFSLSIAPALELTQSDSAAAGKRRALYAGVSLPVFNLPALQRVRDEIALASSFIPGETLLNNGFSSDSVAEKLSAGGYGILHLASHSRIADEVEDSFILTFDGKMTLNNLRDLLGATRYSQTPVRLLSLSACSTAEGSRRAALGLAGLAVKSGAQSVLASLWPINDTATAQLVAEFYRQLADGQGKADALRQAQLSLLRDARFEHPNNWAAFVLVGDWR